MTHDTNSSNDDVQDAKRKKKLKVKAVDGVECSVAKSSTKKNSSPLIDEPPSSSNGTHLPEPAKGSCDSEARSESPKRPPPVSSNETEPSLPSENDVVRTTNEPSQNVWDLECALHHVMDSMAPSDGEREYVTKDKDVWVSFRLAHAGDVSEIARLYREEQRRREKRPKDNDEEREDEGSATSLEVRFAEGLGDEDHPPVAFGILGFLHYEKKKVTKDDTVDKEESDSTSTSTNNHHAPYHTTNGRLAAAVLLTEELRLGYPADSIAKFPEEQESCTAGLVRVEWMHIQGSFDRKGHSSRNNDLAKSIGSHLWLRLASVGVLTNSPIRLVDSN